MLFPTPDEINAQAGNLVTGDKLSSDDQDAVSMILSELFLRSDFDASDFPDTAEKLSDISGYRAKVILAAKKKILDLGSSAMRLDLAGVGKVTSDDERVDWARLILTALYQSPAREEGEISNIAVGPLRDPFCWPHRW